jgi:hypothetical protein
MNDSLKEYYPLLVPIASLVFVFVKKAWHRKWAMSSGDDRPVQTTMVSPMGNQDEARRQREFAERVSRMREKAKMSSDVLVPDPVEKVPALREDAMGSLLQAAGVEPSVVPKEEASLESWLKNRRGLKRAVLMSEIIKPPMSLR